MESADEPVEGTTLIETEGGHGVAFDEPRRTFSTMGGRADWLPVATFFDSDNEGAPACRRQSVKSFANTILAQPQSPIGQRLFASVNTSRGKLIGPAFADPPREIIGVVSGSSGLTGALDQTRLAAHGVGAASADDRKAGGRADVRGSGDGLPAWRRRRCGVRSRRPTRGCGTWTWWR